MGNEGPRDHEKAADNHRKNGDFEKAGEYYTAAAYDGPSAGPPRQFGTRISHSTYDRI